MPASIPSITVLLPRDTKRKLERRAESEGLKVGPYVRRLIERELAPPVETPPPTQSERS